MKNYLLWSIVFLCIVCGLLFYFLTPKILVYTQEKPLRNEIFDGLDQDTTAGEIEEIKKLLTEKNNATTTSPITNSVHYTPFGFDPAVFLVAKGEMVSFVNKSGKEFWPASSPHPTHTDYLDFDSKGPLPNDAIFEFIFEKAGDFGYHDHLSPQKVGVIRVVEL